MKISLLGKFELWQATKLLRKNGFTENKKTKFQRKFSKEVSPDQNVEITVGAVIAGITGFSIWVNGKGRGGLIMSGDLMKSLQAVLNEGNANNWEQAKSTDAKG